MSLRKSMVTIDNENYLRIILLLLEGSTYICKLVFNRELHKHGGILDSLLKTWKNKLQHEFHKRQMEKFFPNGGFDKTDIHKWDIQMIIGVMLLLFRSTLTDKEKQILKDIKFIRHEVLAHSSSASLCDEKYEDVRKQLEDAIKHLAESFDQDVKIKCNDYIKSFTSAVLDVNSAIHRLQEAKDTDDLFQKILCFLRETKDSLTKEIREVKQDLTTKTNSITKQIEKIEDAECNTFKALTNVQKQIETLEKWLHQNFKDQGSRSSDDFRSLSNQLQEKNKEIQNKIQTYDDSSLQITETGSGEIQIDRSMTLKTVDGKEMLAKTVFAAAIRYLKEDLLNKINMQLSAPLEGCDIHWVITVPAIWSDQAKQFMREAAYESGIDGESLSIALESEVASIYCQKIPVCKTEEQQLVAIASGRKYMVVDLGGGTIDISVHEKQTDGRLREVCIANGGTVGSMMINDEFIGVFQTVIGQKLFQLYQHECPADYLELQRTFESKKRALSMSSGKIVLRVPYSLIDFCLQHRQKTLKNVFNDSIYKTEIEVVNDKLKINANVLRSFCDNYTSLVIKHVSELFENDSLRDTGIILMVGGPSQSPFIQDAMVQNFPCAKVIIPAEPVLAVVNGAVLFGHKPQIISSRISRYSYGLSITPVFDRTIHTESRRVRIDGKDRCRDVFMKFLSCGDTVRIGDARTWQLSSIHKQQDKMVIKVYVSVNHNPLYVDEKGTNYLGDIVVDLPDRENEIVHVNVSMLFGGTELIVEATEISKSKTVRAYFDCL